MPAVPACPSCSTQFGRLRRPAGLVGQRSGANGPMLLSPTREQLGSSPNRRLRPNRLHHRANGSATPDRQRSAVATGCVPQSHRRSDGSDSLTAPSTDSPRPTRGGAAARRPRCSGNADSARRVGAGLGGANVTKSRAAPAECWAQHDTPFWAKRPARRRVRRYRHPAFVPFSGIGYPQPEN